MLRIPLLFLSGCITFAFFAAAIVAQEAPAAPAADPAALMHLDYPDSPGGLEKLASDLLKAQKQGDTTRATALASTMVLPDATAWYTKVFGDYSAQHEGAAYEKAKKNIPEELLAFFQRAKEMHETEISAKKFEASCDDDAGENTFGLLQERLEPVPLYELRFFDGSKFTRLWLMVYVDGAFRYATEPHPYNFMPPPFRKPAPAKPSDAPSDVNDAKPELGRIRQGGNVTAASLIQRVQPVYPDISRRERLSGTVRLHAIIGKDGSITKLKVMSGYCSLAESSVKAVSQWRYRPTTINGNPVEVDTTIDVIFQLNR